MKWAILLLFFSPAVMAGNFSLHTVSNHVDCNSCNEQNYGVGYRWDGETAPLVGVFRNSQYNTAVYAGISHHIGNRVYISGGLITGYETPVFGTISWRMLDKKVSPMLTFLPSRGGGVVLLSIDWRL